jgi:hypothetical protein
MLKHTSFNRDQLLISFLERHSTIFIPPPEKTITRPIDMPLDKTAHVFILIYIKINLNFKYILPIIKNQYEIN